MSEHKIHDRLPNGFSAANEQQEEQYERTGSVRGARKVALVKTRGGERTYLAVRLEPPKRWSHVMSRLPQRQAVAAGLVEAGVRDSDKALSWYVREYNSGYAAAGRSGDSRLWESGMSSHAWDDGYLDRAAGRAKWHLTYCEDHDECGEG